MSSIHPRALAIAVSRASRLAGFIAGFAEGACTMPFTAAKLGAVHASMIVVVMFWPGSGALMLGSAVGADASLARTRRISNAWGFTITLSTYRSIRWRSSMAVGCSATAIDARCFRTPSSTRFSISGAGTRATLPASAFRFCMIACDT